MKALIFAGLAAIAVVAGGHLIIGKYHPLDILGGVCCSLIVLLVIAAMLSYLGAV